MRQTITAIILILFFAIACIVIEVAFANEPDHNECVTGITKPDSSFYSSLPAGMKAPPIEGRNEKGKCRSLAHVKSRYTLLYFYEVHCQLCAAVTPELKKLYDSYHKLGLEVIAVPIESQESDWIDYVHDQHLTWENIFVVGKKNDLLKKEYRLEVSPTIYLLDKNKVLLTPRMMRAEQVEEEINMRIR